ncbi:hypothetical protein PIB30_080943 [Stylosanthes scabra]|uniref:Uncharacterized protein n=1 Tax=Stylosanthes scabra TaxID=79078 RepID=A0ABU6WUR5_9FABA|nr:hypothetical protein [Stylosanthes scabra]
MVARRLQSFALFLILLSFILGGMSRPLHLNTHDHKKPIKTTINALKPTYISVKRLVAEAGQNHSKANTVRKLVVDQAGPSPQGEGHGSTTNIEQSFFLMHDRHVYKITDSSLKIRKINLLRLL